MGSRQCEGEGVSSSAPPPICLRGPQLVAAEVRQSAVSLCSAPGVQLNTGDVQAAGPEETRTSWLMLGVAFLFHCVYGVALFAPPVYYVTYMQVFGVSKATGAWVPAVYVFCCFMIGVVASPCVVWFGCRRTTLVGSVVMVVALALSSLASNLATIFVLQSAVAGCGAGVTFIGVSVMLPQHFGERRALACSLALTGLGVGMVLAPVLLAALIQHYTWRGAVLIQAAIMAHKLPLALLFREPRRRHTRPTTAQQAETTSTRTQQEGRGRARRMLLAIRGACDCSMLADPLFLLYCLSNLLTRVNSTTLINHMLSFLVTRGFSLDQAAQVASVAGGCNVAGRVVAGLACSYPRLNLLAVYAAVMLLNAASTLLLLHLPGLTGKAAAAAIYGFAFGFDYPFVPAVLVELCGLERLAHSLALYNLLSLASVILAAPPLAGWLYDLTANYSLPFYLSAALATAGCGLALLLARLMARRGGQGSGEREPVRISCS